MFVARVHLCRRNVCFKLKGDLCNAKSGYLGATVENPIFGITGLDLPIHYAILWGYDDD